MMGFGEMLKVSTLRHRAAPSGTLSQHIRNSILKFDKMPSRAHGCDLGACLLMGTNRTNRVGALMSVGRRRPEVVGRGSERRE